jgi:hypothetical protein
MQRKKTRVSKQQPADEVDLKERLEILGSTQELEKKVAQLQNIAVYAEFCCCACRIFFDIFPSSIMFFFR